MNDRIAFLDKLRSLVILCVIAFHCAVGYSSSAPFWPFHGEDLGRGLDLLLYIADMAMMPLLFCVSGYFAYVSYRKRGGWSFFRPRLVRLGLPWLAISFLVLPLLDYLHYRLRLIGDIDLTQYLLLCWKTICTPFFGYLDMSGFIPLTTQYYQRYMWYLSLLLAFYAITPLIAKLVDRWSGQVDSPIKIGRGLIVLYLAAGSLAAAVLIFLHSGMKWFSLGNIVQFQPVKLALFLPLFCFGAWCGRRGVFREGGLFRRSWPIGLAALALLVPSFASGMVLSRSAQPEWWMGCAYGLAYAGLTLTAVLFTLNLAARNWNRPARFWAWLSPFSYEIYLVHYAWVLTIPLLFQNTPGLHPIAKLALVLAICLAGAVATARVFRR